MRTPSPYLNFEFQGGEPTVNMDVIKFVVDYSREKNKYEKDSRSFIGHQHDLHERRECDWIWTTMC